MAPAKLLIRKLRAPEVTFTVHVDPEPESPDGLFEDQATVQTIMDAVESGQMEAWCAITVRATWEGFEAVDHLGGCSHLASEGQPSVQDQVARTIAAHDMKAQALHYLNQVIQREADLLARLVRPRKRGSGRNG